MNKLNQLYKLAKELECTIDICYDPDAENPFDIEVTIKEWCFPQDQNGYGGQYEKTLSKAIEGAMYFLERIKPLKL